jgi:hypothetical protein
MKNILGLITLACGMFCAGVWFERLVIASSTQGSVDIEYNTALLSDNVAKNKHSATVSVIPKYSHKSKKEDGEQPFIHQNDMDLMERLWKNSTLNTQAAVSLYLSANNPQIQDKLIALLSDNLAEQSIVLANSMLNDTNPKARELAYGLLGAMDVDDANLVIQLIDASYTETDPSATLMLFESMANICAYSTEIVTQVCVERMINVIEFSEPDLATKSLALLSRMPATRQSMAIFSEKLTSDIAAQKLTALDALFNAKTLDEHTLMTIRSIANDQEASVVMRDLADELLRHLDKSEIRFNRG